MSHKKIKRKNISKAQVKLKKNQRTEINRKDRRKSKEKKIIEQVKYSVTKEEFIIEILDERFFQNREHCECGNLCLSQYMKGEDVIRTIASTFELYKLTNEELCKVWLAEKEAKEKYNTWIEKIYKITVEENNFIISLEEWIRA